MKAGDILFVRGKGFISNAVRYFDKGDFSHVAVAVSETHVLEAQFYTRSRIVPNYFEDFIIVDLDLTEDERDFVVHAGIQMVGRYYDYFKILGYVLKHPFDNPNNMICSEIIAFLLEQLGMYAYDEVIYLKPNELYRLLME